jgi:hypothetical protein
MIQRITAWIGVFGFMIGALIQCHQFNQSKRLTFLFSGLASFLIVRMWFEKAIDDFNNSIVSQGKNAPELVAAAGNGFTSAYREHMTQGLNCNFTPQWSGLPTHFMLFLSLSP